MDIHSHRPVSLPSFAEPLLSVGSPIVRPLSLPGDPSYGATSHTRKTTLGSRKKQKNVPAQGDPESGSYRSVSTTGKLSDDVLLEIFDFCRKSHKAIIFVWPWHVLVHVCQRWRQIVFASPHRLHLRIFCRNGTPVRKSLGIWPAFPIVITYGHQDGHPRSHKSTTPNDEDNVLAALEHPDRVCSLEFNGTGSQLETMATAMQEPFPVLRCLILFSSNGNTRLLPAEFLGGSAPCLQKIHLSGIPYPGLPKLLLSTSDLVKLYLLDIPPTGYISPEAMAACLVALPKLEKVNIGFRLAARPKRIHPPPLTRSVLPALTSFVFQGASEYLEDLVARIDGPRLNHILIHYHNQLSDFQVTQFSKFIDHSVCPEFTQFKRAYIVFSHDWVDFTTRRDPSHLRWDQDQEIRDSTATRISCQGIDWQVSHMAQVLSQLSTTLSNIVHLSILLMGMGGLESIDGAEWLHLLRHLSTVHTLYVSLQLAGHIARAMEDITVDIATEVLPSLALIYLAGEPASSVEKFVAVRQLSGRPVTVVHTYTEFKKSRESYVSK